MKIVLKTLIQNNKKIDTKIKSIVSSPKIQKIKSILAPYTKRAYLVGGCVRDIFLENSNIQDYDIEVYDISPNKFDQIMKQAGAICVGSSFFIYKIGQVDIGLARSETKIGLKHNDFSVKYENDEYLASLRRDFSINSIMINIFSKKVLDYHEGLKDLNHKIIKHIDNDKFKEDSLRVLRGIQFAARFGFKIAPKTLKLMSSMDISNLSKHRILEELLKMFKAKNKDIGANYLYKLGLIKKLFGICIDKKEFIFFKKTLKIAQKQIIDEALFLYIFCGYFGLDPKKTLNLLGLENRLKKAILQPFFKDDLSDDKLLLIACDMKLKEWLGCYGDRLKKAKKYGVYENKFNHKVDVKDIIKDGFKAENIAKELQNRKKIAIQNWLQQQKTHRQ